MSQKWNEEFEAFSKEAGVAPPASLHQKVLATIEQDLCPSTGSVLLKRLAIHLGVALATLTVCPQFGFRVLGEGMGLMHYFMAFGPYGCFAACGFFFLGSSALVASLVMKPGELKLMRKQRWLEAGSLALFSLVAFSLVNAEVLLHSSLPWLAGALAGGLLMLELTWRARLRLQAGWAGIG